MVGIPEFISMSSDSGQNADKVFSETLSGLVEHGDSGSVSPVDRCAYNGTLGGFGNIMEGQTQTWFADDGFQYKLLRWKPSDAVLYNVAFGADGYKLSARIYDEALAGNKQPCTTVKTDTEVFKVNSYEYLFGGYR